MRAANRRGLISSNKIHTLETSRCVRFSSFHAVVQQALQLACSYISMRDKPSFHTKFGAPRPHQYQQCPHLIIVGVGADLGGSWAQNFGNWDVQIVCCLSHVYDSGVVGHFISHSSLSHACATFRLNLLSHSQTYQGSCLHSLYTIYTFLNHYRLRAYLIICFLSLSLNLLICTCTPAVLLHPDALVLLESILLP